MKLVIALTFSCLVWLTAAKKIDCEKSETIREDRIHLCCKHPDGHHDIFDSCAKETGFKLPNPQEQSIVDLTADRAIAGSCFAKCVFGKLNFMQDKNLDMEAIKKFYNEKYVNDVEYAKEMINAFDHCHSKVEENTSKFLSNHIFKQMSTNFCDPKPAVIMACVIRQFFHNCPADRWAKTKECEDTLAFSKKCRDTLATL